MQNDQTGAGAPGRQLTDLLHAVGPGWHSLLLQLHEQLVARAPDYRVADLKEKLGGVRIHLATAMHPEMRALLAAAEAQSTATCEFCGAPGRGRRRRDAAHGWIKTVCDSCHTAWSRHSILIVRGVVRRREEAASGGRDA